MASHTTDAAGFWLMGHTSANRNDPGYTCLVDSNGMSEICEASLEIPQSLGADVLHNWIVRGVCADGVQ